MSQSAMSEMTGARVLRGFEITCPNVEPARREIHKVDNGKSLKGLITARSSVKTVELLHRSRCDINSSWEFEKVEHLFYETMVRAYSDHYPVSLRPEVIWHLIAHEMGVYTNQNKDVCAAFFTDTPDKKKKLEIFVDFDQPIEVSLLRFRQEFEPNIASNVLQAFLPKFTTTDIEAETATLLTFMDTVSPWYEYSGFGVACGFPKILLEGTVEDWKLLHASVTRLHEMFEGFRPFLANLVDVVARIVATIETGDVDPDFWSSMFRYKGGSGQSFISGWLSSFIAYTRGEPPELRTSFEWGEKGGVDMDSLRDGVNFADMPVTYGDGSVANWVLTSGILGTDYEEGYLVPRLGFAVAKLPS